MGFYDLLYTYMYKFLTEMSEEPNKFLVVMQQVTTLRVEPGLLPKCMSLSLNSKDSYVILYKLTRSIY